MEMEHTDPALRAANLALVGKRVQRRPAGRFASVELRAIESSPASDRRNIAWETAAVLSIGAAAVLAVIGLWLL